MDYAKRVGVFMRELYSGTPKKPPNKNESPKKNTLTLRNLLNSNKSLNVAQISYGSCGTRQKTSKNNVQVCKPLRVTISQNSSKGTPLVIKNKTVESLDPGSYLFL